MAVNARSVRPIARLLLSMEQASTAGLKVFSVAVASMLAKPANLVTLMAMVQPTLSIPRSSMEPS